MAFKHLPMLFMLLLVIAVQILSVSMMPALYESEVRVFEDPNSTSNVIFYVGLVLVFTVFLLLAIKLDFKWAVALVIQISLAMSIFYVLSAFSSLYIALVVSAVLTICMITYPEWYVVDVVGLLVSAGVGTLFGLSLSTVPALVLLVILAVYDALSVYKTKHMVTLAEGAINIRAPLLFVIPKNKGYSFRKHGRDGNAYFLGLGDAIIPTVLVISAGWSLPMAAHPYISWTGLNYPALGAMIGTWVGFLLLSTTSRDTPHAGLPFLNGGAIAGFLIACLLYKIPPF